MGKSINVDDEIAALDRASHPDHLCAYVVQVEYSKDGRVIKGAPKAVVRSKYQEDVMNNNHSSVWGSFYDRRTGKWGYSCCHSIIKMSYCTGEEGKKANEQYTSAIGKLDVFLCPPPFPGHFRFIIMHHPLTTAETAKPKPVEETNKIGDENAKSKSKLKTNLTVR